jgi:hypothetical protein
MNKKYQKHFETIETNPFFLKKHYYNFFKFFEKMHIFNKFLT